MKYISTLLLAVLFGTFAIAGENDGKGIKWMNWEEVQVAMKKEPKKVWVDVYTDWCGWCKVMDKKTYSNPEVIKYMNEHFYAVKFNAEGRDDIRFMGTTFSFEPQYKANKLAVELMRGQMSYPTNVFMEKHFQNPSPIPGYQGVPQMELILKYLAEDTYKTVKFDEYQKTFTPSWQEGS
ncbi:MAG: DUF255 domain-containing protein [Chitinophagales bacterium]|nr:DUF255 domain-containing protein [Chitinophagaceae bacterium]MCB9063942.1 DUF255 domain-containing protein [Chitinophagales bacterium]